MKEQLIVFLTEKYGNRIDHPQPLIDTDSASIQQQLKLVDKRIGRVQAGGYFWAGFGILWLVLGVYTLVEKSVDFINGFYVGLGVFYIASGFTYLIQATGLKRKKVILETILYIRGTME